MSKSQLDVLDLIINTLDEYEEHLDSVLERCEKVAIRLERFADILEQLDRGEMLKFYSDIGEDL